MSASGDGAADPPVPIALLYVPFGGDEEAGRVARLIVEEGLAGCANRLAPCRSMYLWDGAVAEATEYPVLFKVAAPSADAASARIAELHGYSLPAIVRLPAEAAPAFAAFLAGEAGS